MTVRSGTGVTAAISAVALGAVALAAFAPVACGGSSGGGSQDDVDAAGQADAPAEGRVGDAEDATPPGDAVVDGTEEAPVPDAHDPGREAVPEVSTECPGGSGCDCAADGDCDSGLCLETRDGMRCTHRCGAGEACAKGWTCQVVEGHGPDPFAACVDPSARLCRPCMNGMECLPAAPSGNRKYACLPNGTSGSFCAIDCVGEDDCAAGFTCVEAPWGQWTARQCRPIAGECPCTEYFESAAFTTICAVENAHGRCEAVRTCDLPCPAPEPAAEACNGKDDDCDDATDEGFGEVSCGIGACAVTVSACDAGEPRTCTPGTPGLESCNGLDDDCDGETDEELGTDSCGAGACAVTGPTCKGGKPWTCTPKSPGTEVCNGIDDDCDDDTDEGLADLTCGTGQCAASVPACVGGSPGACTPGTAGTEVCNGLDDDCDGAFDEPQDACPAGMRCDGTECVPECAPAVDGGWTDWTCGACSAECGGGTRPCTRTCTAPEPSCGGAQCDGLDAMDEPCNVQSCCPPGYNVVNCNPSAPGDKDACEAALSASRATCQALGCTPSDPGACTVGGSPSNAECYGAIGTCN